MALALLAGVAVCHPVAASAPSPDPESGAYQGIVNRNIFGLRAPPAAATNEPARPDIPKLFLGGIATVVGVKQAFLTMQEPGTKAQPGKQESLVLTEGQREGPVEVLNIDEHAGAVRVNNSGTVTTLTFDKDLAKPPIGAPGGVPTNTALAQAGVPLASNALARTIPTRAYRGPFATPNAGGALMPPGSGTTSAAGASTAVVPVVPGTAQTVTPTLPSPVGQLTPEQQQVLRQIQEQVARQNSAQSRTPIAPTPLTGGGTPPGVIGVTPPPPGYVPPPQK